MKKFDKQCKECGKDFIAMNVQRLFCSNACSVKNSKKNNPKIYQHTCKNCGKDFENNIKKTQFCSLSCAGKKKNSDGTGIMFKCRQCGNEFKQKHKRHFFCSNNCKSKFNDKTLTRIKVNCSNCNKEIERFERLLKTQKNFFCSKNCEYRFREKTANDTRICEYCKNEFSCKKGDKLRFCSVQCQKNWQKETLVGKNANDYDHTITDEMRTKKCECCGKDMIGTPRIFETKKYCSYGCKVKSMPKSMSFPHRETIRILEELNIDYEIESTLGRYSLDCIIDNSSLCIEVSGTFWHCDNRVYESPVSPIQEKSIKRDKRKIEKIRESNMFVLYIWEKDINENYEMCKKLIQDFIKKNGKLNNCHSMNYFLKNGKLKLRNEILIPFFER